MRPEQAYVICTLPRSGSYLLSEALGSTEVAGYPAEYLNANHDGYFQSLLGDAKFADYSIVFDTAMRVGTTPNGVFAIKVLWFHLDQMRRRFNAGGHYLGLPAMTIFRQLLPPTRYVRLIRRNKVQQAISYLRAADSRVWYATNDRSTAAQTSDGQIDIEKLAAWKRRLEGWEADWDHALNAAGEPVLTLYYEDIQDDLMGAVREVHDFIGIDLPRDFSLPPPSLRRQRDTVSQQWEEAFLRAEQHRCATMPA